MTLTLFGAERNPASLQRRRGRRLAHAISYVSVAAATTVMVLLGVRFAAGFVFVLSAASILAAQVDGACDSLKVKVHCVGNFIARGDLTEIPKLTNADTKQV